MGGCNSHVVFDDKPGGDLSAGLSLATSQGCAECTFSINASNSASTVDIGRKNDADPKGKRILIRPLIPFQVTFNGTVHAIDHLEWYYPSPLRVEGTNADGMLACVSEQLTIYIPLTSTRNFAGTQGGAPAADSTNFFGDISPRLAELKQDQSIEGISVGQNWSLSKLIPTDAPFFTWIQSEYQQYTKYAVPCGEMRIGYRETPGPRAIFLKNPAVIADNDMALLQHTVGRIDPTSIVSSLPQVYYYPPNTPCPANAKCGAKKAAANNDVGIKIAIGVGVLLCLCFVAIVIPIVFEDKTAWMPRYANYLKSMPTTGILFVIFMVLIVFGLTAAGIAGAYK